MQLNSKVVLFFSRCGWFVLVLPVPLLLCTNLCFPVVLKPFSFGRSSVLDVCHD